MSNVRAELGVPHNVVTEVFPGVWVKHTLGTNVHMVIQVHGYQAPRPSFNPGAPRDAYIPRKPATDPADAPGAVAVSDPFAAQYDQRCAALPIGQHVEHCHCSGKDAPGTIRLLCKCMEPDCPNPHYVSSVMPDSLPDRGEAE